MSVLTVLLFFLNFYVGPPQEVKTWNYQAIELVEEIGKRTANITGDPKEMAYLFQQLSVAV